MSEENKAPSGHILEDTSPDTGLAHNCWFDDPAYPVYSVILLPLHLVQRCGQPAQSG
jgi:hypothetical protein